jgi:8-hydroxy-5-deazaflavin:NADPH oxidoreductase
LDGIGFYSVLLEKDMDILVIGAGNMGTAFTRQLTAAGHQVTLTSRNMDKARALAEQLPTISVVEPAGSAAGRELVILATGYADAVTALRAVGDLSGKIVIDLTNPLTPDYMGLTIGHSTSAAEEIALAVPGAIIVKAFNTLFAQVLAGGADFGGGQRVTVFVASDNAAARQTVSGLAEGLGYLVSDAGSLKNARYLEPLAGLNVYLGYGAGQGVGIAPTWIYKA